MTNSNAQPDTAQGRAPSRFVMFVSAGLVFGFSCLALVFPDIAGDVLITSRNWVISRFDWFFALIPPLILLACLGLAVSPAGKLRLGGDAAKPEFSTLSWIAMLFASGVGIGLMFYGPSEPLGNYTDWAGTPLGTTAGSDDARRLAMSATIFHWGLAPWAIYAVMGLALGYYAYNRGLPLSIRSAFYPLIGDRIWGWPGHIVDLFAIVATVFGLATSIGIGAAQTATGLSLLYGFEQGIGLQLIMIAVITGLAMVSVVRGVNGGIRWLSNANMLLALSLFLFVLIAGPTGELIKSMFTNTASYLADSPALTNWIGRDDEAWFHDWTIFYWAWWVSWSPFVGMFIARISKGRTLREYLTVIIVLPSLIAVVWFTVFGETALQQYEAGIGGLAEGIETAPLALFHMLAELPLAEITSSVSTLLLIIFIVTSVDSGALVVETLASGGGIAKPRKWRIFWASMLGATAAVLLYGGGRSALQALQAGTIVAALPFAVIVLIATFGLIAELVKETRGGGN